MAARILRFTITERAAHWLTASAFAVMLVSGPAVPHRWSLSTVPFDIHVGAAVVLVCGLAFLLLSPNRGVLRRTARDLTTVEDGDREWLASAPTRALRGGEAPPAGRFNAGQKVNFVLVSLGLAGLYATGAVLVLAGRGPQGPLHHLAAIAMVGLVACHIYMAVINPATRHALRGITLGEVDADWAAHHHPRWAGGAAGEETASPR